MPLHAPRRRFDFPGASGGRVFTESFDRASLTRTNVTPEGRTSTTVFDANGRVVQTQLPGRLPTAMAYDANGRLIEVTQGSRSWSYTYDARSNLDTVTNPLTETTAFDYDLVGRVTREESALGNVTTFGYDPNGNRTQFEDPIAGVVITADYDAQDRLLRYGDTTYTHSENGERFTSTSPLGTTTFDYDVFANLRALTVADGTAIEYAIDPTDRRIATFEDGLLDHAFVYRDDLEPLARLDRRGRFGAI